MVTRVITCAATAEAKMSSRTASPPITASRSTSVVLAGVRAERSLHPTATHESARRRSCALTRSVRACVDSGVPSASRPPRSSAGSKKATELDLKETLLFPEAPAEDEALELDELWSFVYPKSDKVWVWLALCRRTRQVSWPSSLAIGAGRPASVYGEPSRRATRRRPATATCGKLTSRRSRKTDTKPRARRRARPATSRGGSTPCVSGFRASLGIRSPSPSLIGCTTVA